MRIEVCFNDDVLTYEVGEECEKGIVVDIEVSHNPPCVKVVADGGEIMIAGAPFYYSE